MEWVETTGKTVDEAKDQALDQLGVAADEAEFEVLEEPRAGLFGRLRGEARVRSRVRPNELRPKTDRRRRRNDRSRSQQNGAGSNGAADGTAGAETTAQPAAKSASTAASTGGSASTTATERAPRSDRSNGRAPKQATDMASTTDQPSPDEVGTAAVAFMDDLVRAFGLEGSSSLSSEGIELDLAVEGKDLGVLIGPGGRTLAAVQNLARVAAQRRLGDHETRLRIDVAGYREKRQVALEAFAERIANEVQSSGTARALEPMTSADRKIIHDALNDIGGVASRSEGDDPRRYVVVAPES